MVTSQAASHGNSYRTSRTLVKNLFDTANSFGDKAAYRCGNQTISYSALKEKSLHIACGLRRQGVSKGDCVGVALNRSLDMIVAVYAVMMAGAAYVPLDPLAPRKRVQLIARQCDLKLLVCGDKLLTQMTEASPDSDSEDRHSLAAIAYSYSSLDNDPLKNGCAQDVLDCSENALAVQPDDLAYVIFTSGTTGEPKGIAHTHASASAFVKMMVNHFELSSTDSVVATSALYFDMSTFDLFVTDAVGATTVLATEAHMKMPASLTQLLETSRVTLWYATPSAISLAINHGAPDKRNLKALRWLIYAGEAFPPKALHIAKRWFPNARVSNAYGPAETNVTHIFNLPQSMELQKRQRPIPIGYPCENVAVEIESSESCPYGTGELCLATPSLMRGYVGADDLNTEKLFVGEKGARFYRTGDLIERDDDELFHFLGRVDRQVKIRGVRIELEEVEHAICQLDGVEQCAVSVCSIGHDQGTENTRMVADVLLTTESKKQASELLAELVDVLPHSSIPDDLAIHQHFPMSHTGKLDRMKLAEAWF